MVKSITLYLISFIVLYLIALSLHQYILEVNIVDNRFQLKPVYFFFAIASFLICVVFKSFTFFEKTREQLGFLYLFTIFIKILVFVILFYKSIISFPNITKTESLNILIPLFIFLFLEVFFISRILNNKNE